ncbi:MAG: amino acid ABC transporter permease [Actinomycetota bacterium]|nr:amino acid ABC transporter permease [Actinomycetota bacterium]
MTTTTTDRSRAEKRPAGAGPSGGAAAGLERTERRLRRNTGVKLVGVLAALLLAFVVQGIARNSALEWRVVGSYLFSGPILDGVLRTLLITVTSIAIAVVLGVLLANMRLSRNRVLQAVNAVYVWFFRSIPLLVLLIIAYNFSLLYAHLSLGLPFGPSFVTFTTAHVVTALTAAIITFGLQQAAYTSEVVRAAIMSVSRGQVEAAETLGVTYWGAMRRIVLPQAARIALPPVANETINLCKSTSLVAFISVPDLLYSVQEVYAANFKVLPLLVVATIWYMAIVSVMSAAQWWLERSMRRTRRTTRIALAPEVVE